MLLKETYHLCANYIAPAAYENLFSNIVTAHIKMFSTPDKHKSKFTMLGMNSDYVVVEPIVKV